MKYIVIRNEYSTRSQIFVFNKYAGLGIGDSSLTLITTAIDMPMEPNEIHEYLKFAERTFMIYRFNSILHQPQKTVEESSCLKGNNRNSFVRLSVMGLMNPK